MKISGIAVFIIYLFNLSSASNIAELFGMEDLLEGLAKMSPTVNYLGETSTAYILDPNIYTFLRRFNNRT